MQSGKVNTNTVMNSLWGPQMCVMVIDRFLSGEVRVRILCSVSLIVVVVSGCKVNITSASSDDSKGSI